VLLVVVDSATPAVTAALVRLDPAGPVLVAERTPVDAKAHGELLAPAVDAVLREGGVKPRDLTAIVAGLGPGPFTGLRVGLVTAATMGHALGLPTYGVCSLDGIGAATAGEALVATDARRREVYWARYRGGERVGEPAVDRPADVPTGGVEAAYGDGAHLYAEQLGLPVATAPRYPVATLLAGLAADRVRSGAPGEALTPLYLRRPDATVPAGRKPALP
jgi:tRNA threonylcarbamoyl adenosine modification protein YeaZ